MRGAAAPLHMAMWGHGRLDATVGSVIDATVAVPAYTLAMAGLPSLPREYMLQLRARGPAEHPTIDWLQCAPGLTVNWLECAKVVQVRESGSSAPGLRGARRRACARLTSPTVTGRR